MEGGAGGAAEQVTTDGGLPSTGTGSLLVLGLEPTFKVSGAALPLEALGENSPSLVQPILCLVAASCQFSASVFSSPFPVCVCDISFCLPLVRKHVIIFRTCRINPPATPHLKILNNHISKDPFSYKVKFRGSRM